MSAPPAHPKTPVIGHTVDVIQDLLGFHDEVAAETGDLARVDVLGVGEYCIAAHPDHFEQILVTDPESFAKTVDFEIAFGQSVLTTEGETWRRQREDLEEFFYPGKIRSYADDMVGFTERRLDTWTPGETLSLYEEMRHLTLENLFGTLFDRPLRIGADEQLRQAADDLNLWFKASSYALPRWVPTPARRRFHEAVDVLETEARRLIREREQADGGDDLLSTLVALREQGASGMTDDEIVDQLVTMIFAGHDTTAFALTAALHQLGTHPDVRERFHAELADVLDGARPTLADVGDLTVTANVVNETLRRYPSLFTIPRKTTRPVELGGYQLPADTRIHLSFWRAHRDERFWDDPDAWRPARWTTTSPREQGHSFVPFGAGRRACIGRRFARLEATLVLATIGQRYRLDPKGPLVLEPEMTMSAGEGALARVHERDG
ncbi:cytochrome P450 [Halosegnis sp.]|uniref:cytochrome P450 n=1 Tax=Halosegnis sp. TaxID=2864959 RepID=UPI0035D3F9C7